MGVIDAATLANTLSGIFQSPVERTLATVGILILAAVVAGATRRYGERLGELTRPVVADVATTVLYLGALAGATLLSAAVWDRMGLVFGVADTTALDARTVPRLVVSGVIIVVARVVAGFVRRLLSRLAESRAALERHEGEVLEYVVGLVLYATAFVVLLGVWNFDIQGLLIGAGFLGIVVGMAARQSLGAVFAGVVLMFSKPFEIDDWIVVGDDEGIVEDISIVNTRVRTFDGESVIIPNDMVNSQQVINRTYRERLRIELEVGVDYGTDVDRAREVAVEAMEGVDLVLASPAPRTVGKRFGDSAIVLGLRYWISNPTAERMWQANTAVIGAVTDAFDEAGVEIPFPQRALSGRGGAFEVTADGPVAAGQQRDGEDREAEPTTDGGSAER